MFVVSLLMRRRYFLRQGIKGLVVDWYCRYASPLLFIRDFSVGGMPVTLSNKKVMMMGAWNVHMAIGEKRQNAYIPIQMTISNK